MAQSNTRIEQFKIEEILELVRANRNSAVILCNETVPTGTLSLRCFRAHGTNCLRCGVKGLYFLLERHVKNNKFHLTLYAQSESGDEIPMTVDHIKPKSKGGTSSLDNVQTLCYLCNQTKADDEQYYRNVTAIT